MKRWAYLSLFGQSLALLHLADLNASVVAVLSLLASTLLTTRYVFTTTKKEQHS